MQVNDYIHKSLPNRIVYLFLVIIVFVSYFPVTQGYYLMEDDYWSYLDRSVPLKDNQAFKSQALYAVRPLGALINFGTLKYVSGISDLNYVRAFSMVLICLLSLLLFRILQSVGISSFLGFVIAASIFLTPPFQSNVLKIFEINALFSILMSLVSSFLSIKFICSNDTKDKIRFIFCCSLFIQLLSLITYTHAITFFWFPLFVYISLTPIATIKERIVRILLASASPLIVMICFALFYKAFFVAGPGHDLTLSLTNLPSKINWYFLRAVPAGIDFFGSGTIDNYRNIWAFRGVGIINYLILLFSLFGFISFLSKDIKSMFSEKKNLSFVAIKTAILLSFVMLSIAPLFFSISTSTTYRRFQAMQALFIYLSLSGLYFLVESAFGKYRKQINIALLSVLLCVFVYTSQRMVEHKVGLLSSELRLIHKGLADNFSKDTKMIHVIQSDKISRYQDFVGLMTSNVHWVPGIVLAVLLDASKDIAGNPAAGWNLGTATNRVTASTIEEVIDNSIVLLDRSSTLLIDIRPLEYLLKSDATLRSHSTFWGIKPIYNTENSMPLIVDLTPCCRGGDAISSGDYDGFPAKNAFDDDFVEKRWASREVGPDIFHKAFVGYDFGDSNPRCVSTVVIRQGGALRSVLVQGSNDAITWSDAGILRIIVDSNIRAYRIDKGKCFSKWRLLATDSLPHPAAWSLYEVKFLE